MKIAFDLQAFQGPASVRGIGNYSRNLINRFCEIANNTFDIYGLFIQNKTKDFRFNNNRIKLCQIKNVHYMYAFNCDILIHTSIHLPWENICRIPINLHNKKIFSIVYDLIPFITNSYIGKQKNIYLNKLDYTKKLHKLFCISEEVKKDLIKHLKISENKIDIIYPILDKKFSVKNIDKQKILKEINAENGYILNIGSFEPRKNVNNLIEAYALLPENLKKYKLVLVCNGACINDFSYLINKYKLNEKIVFFNNVSDNQLLELYNAATCSIFPSTIEGFGLPVIESMACGCPVICSDIPIMKEITLNNSIYCNPYDIKSISNAISNMLNNENERLNLINKSLQFVKKYQENDQINKFIDILRRS